MVKVATIRKPVEEQAGRYALRHIGRPNPTPCAVSVNMSQPIAATAPAIACLLGVESGHEEGQRPPHLVLRSRHYPRRAPDPSAIASMSGLTREPQNTTSPSDQNSNAPDTPANQLLAGAGTIPKIARPATKVANRGISAPKILNKS